MPTPTESVDRRQLRALLRAGLKTDWRGAANPFGGMTKGSSKFPPLLGIMIFYFFIGIIMAAMLIAGKGNFFFSALLVNASIMTFIAISILMEFSNVILTPDDWNIVAPLPVNSKTFFVAKLLNLLIYIGILAGAVALPPTLAYIVVSGKILVGLVLLLSMLGAAVATASGFIVLYTLMLRVVDRDRMNAKLGYLQLLLIMAFYFMMLVMPRQLGNFNEMIAGIDIWWLALIPPGWFASLPALLTDGASWEKLLGSGLGIASLTVCLGATFQRLSVGYARSLSNTTSRTRTATNSANRDRRRNFRWFLPEDRIVSRLIRAQFKHDNRFKMSVLAAIPLGILYLYLGLAEGKTLSDPFIPRDQVSGESAILVYLAVAFMPLIVFGALSVSTSWQAAWVFLTNGVNLRRLVLATKRIAMLFFCLPYLLIVFALQIWFFGSVVHALLHSVTLLLLCLLAITLMVIVTGKLPFSMPPKMGRQTSMFVTGYIVPMLLVVPPMMIIAKTGYGGYFGYLVCLLILLIVNVVLIFLQNHVVQKRVASYEMLES